MWNHITLHTYFFSFFLKNCYFVDPFFEICNLYYLWDWPASISLATCRSVIFDCKQFMIYIHLLLFITRKHNRLRETATNSAKIQSLARKYERLRINQMQLRCLHFNQHSITLLDIYMRHWAYKREKYTFLNANIKVINTILKVNRDNWHSLKCKHYSLFFFMTLFASQ